MYVEGKKIVIEDSCLYRMTKTVSLEKKKGDVVETVGKEIFRSFRKHHHGRAKCPVMELLQVCHKAPLTMVHKGAVLRQ